MDRPPVDRTATDAMSVDVWLAEFAAELSGAGLDDIGPDERAVLLDLARIAAHRSHRSAAPITTYHAGLAFAALPRAERLARLRDLATRLDTGPASSGPAGGG